jgi:hypothetical protein
MTQIGQTQDDLTERLLLIVLFGHTSGLHAAGMRRYIPSCWTASNERTRDFVTGENEAMRLPDRNQITVKEVYMVG